MDTDDIFICLSLRTDTGLNMNDDIPPFGGDIDITTNVGSRHAIHTDTVCDSISEVGIVYVGTGKDIGDVEAKANIPKGDVQAAVCVCIRGYDKKRDVKRCSIRNKVEIRIIFYDDNVSIIFVFVRSRGLLSRPF